MFSVYYINAVPITSRALTEKIVAMLPKMNCPHRIEPHQIQGLDCIHIFPVVKVCVVTYMWNRNSRLNFSY